MSATQKDQDYLLLHGLHYLFDEMVKGLAENRPVKYKKWAAEWLREKEQGGAEAARSAIQDVQQAVSGEGPVFSATGGVALPSERDSEKATAAVDRCLARLAYAEGGLSITSVHRPELTRLRVQLTRDRRLIAKWREASPKEPDGSVRVPGGGSLSYAGGILSAGDFPAFEAVEDQEEEHCKQFFCAGPDGRKQMICYDEDDAVSDIDLECVRAAQDWIRSLLARMDVARYGSNATKATLAAAWEELTRWIGADRHFGGLMRVECPAAPS